MISATTPPDTRLVPLRWWMFGEIQLVRFTTSFPRRVVFWISIASFIVCVACTTNALCTKLPHSRPEPDDFAGALSRRS